MQKNQLTGLALAFAVFVGMCTTGCGTGDAVGDAVKAANTNNVSRIANIYGMYQMRTDGYKGPKNEDEFKAFMRDPANAEQVAKMGVDDVDALFTSERDGEPIKVRWNVKGSSRGCYEPVAFETTGADGARLVGFCNGTQEEVSDDATYDDMFKGKYKPPSRDGDGALPKFDANGNEIK